MKNKIATALIILVIASIFGGVTYFKLISPDSEYANIDWDNYEHADMYEDRYYLQLNIKEKIAYENIMANYQTFPKQIEIPELDNDELKKVYTALLYDNPLLFCFDKTCNILSDGSKYYFVPDYALSREEYESRLKEIQNLTPEIISNLPAGDFAVELYLHDYIMDRCTYTDTDSNDERNLYGALISGKASCEGYSNAMKYLADLCEIDCYVIFGSAEAEDGTKGNHMWNIIKIDGEYYHLDATWNDTVAKDDASDEHRYMYFNVTDDEITKTHFNFETENKCTSEKANYYIQNNLNFSVFGEAEKRALSKIIADAADDGNTSVGIRFSTDLLFNQSKNKLIDDQQIYLILSGANKLSKKNIKTQSIHYRCVDDVKVLEFMFSVV